MGFGFKPRQPFVEFAFCAVIGIAVADLVTGNAAFPWRIPAASAVLLVGIACWLAWRDRRCPGVRHGFLAQAVLWLGITALFFSWHSFRQTAGPSRELARRIPSEGCVLSAIGVVDQEPSRETSEARFRVRLESVAFGDGAMEPCSAEILLQWPGAPPAYGARVEVIGSARNIRAPRNPGGFDTPSIRRRQGVYSEIRVRYPVDAKVVARNQGNPVLAFAYRLRHRMERTLAWDLEDSPQTVALIQSMVLGSRASESMQEVEEMFQTTGTIHLYAVTGMNVAMIAVLAGWLLQSLRVPRRGIALAVIPLIWLYCFATGMGASSLRAAVMISVILTGIVIERPALSWNSLGIATVAVLAWDPNQLFRHGFVLSFALVAVLMAVARPVQATLERIAQPDPFLPRVLWSRHLVAWSWGQQHLAAMLAAAFVAWVGSIPLMLYYFHLWSPSTVPANVIGGVLTFAIIGLGIGSVLAGTFSHGLAVIFNNANWLVAKGLLAVIATFAAIPGGHAYVGTPHWRCPPACEVEVFDLSGGGAIHVRINPGPVDWLGWTPPWRHDNNFRKTRRDWLFDCGSVSAFPVTVSPYLRSQGVNYLDGLVITHGDSKHIGGSPAVLKTFRPAEVIDSPLKDRSSHRRTLHTALARALLGKAIVWRGDVVTLAPGIALHVLFPPAGLHARSADDKTLVLRLDVDDPRAAGGTPGTRILFMSDAGFITEHWLLEHAGSDELRCDILVKGMHATDLSGTAEFLEAVRPRLVIASSADFPPAERIKEEWASMVSAHGIRLLRQDRTGAVRIFIERPGTWMAEPWLTDSVLLSD